MRDTITARITGRRRNLLLGMWSAWLYFALSVAYAAAAVASGVVTGSPRDPYWAIAEVITVVGSVILVILVAAIHDRTPAPARMFTLVALGWMMIATAMTITVHLVELTVARRSEVQDGPALPFVFAFEWPSLLMAVELLSWHLFFGLALLFAASGFQGPGAEAVVRTGLRVSAALCLVGLVGPALGNFVWRLPGVLGYGMVFPLLCPLIGYVFKRAASTLTENDADLSQVATTPSD